MSTQLRVTTCKQAAAEPTASACFAAAIRDMRASLMGRPRVLPLPISLPGTCRSL